MLFETLFAALGRRFARSRARRLMRTPPHLGPPRRAHRTEPAGAGRGRGQPEAEATICARQIIAAAAKPGALVFTCVLP